MRGRVFDLFKRKKESEEKIEQGLTKTRQGFFGQIASLFEMDEITDDLWDDLEALLIQADLGVETTLEVVERTRSRVYSERIKKIEAAEAVLKEELVRILRLVGSGAGEPPQLAKPLHVILVTGVNGVGKTTSIAKLASYYKELGYRVVLGAGDTFRAAGVEQLKIWGERVGVPVVSHQTGADPGAVTFDAVQAALAREADVLILDTAGRLHTKYNLMEELKKLRRVVQRLVPDGPQEVLLVMDATTGQNGLLQARHFTEAVQVTGVMLAKLDGTAKGGIVFAIARDLGLPVQYVGTGEKLGDLAEFDPEGFVDALFE
ncbi:MAG: signal recognition particle-docking protein FtsY [Chloroflexi bacterium]|nr:signal recognition particle-docking protein FtsY [Chloroflexota bacterium]